MRRGFLVPSKWRLPDRQRITLPVEVILKRLAAPRCVLAFIFLFFFTISSSLPVGTANLVAVRFFYAGLSALFCADGAEPAPFFGASSASRMFASILGPNSTCA